MNNNLHATSIRKVQRYWDQRPCNIRHSDLPVGSKEYFNEVEKRKYKVEPHIPGFADFSAWKGKKVLEIGCGIGTDTISFARAGAHVTAVDISRKSLSLAEKRANVFGLNKKIRFYKANAEELSKTVKPQIFDLIYSFGVIHHTPHPEKVINEIRKYAGKNTVIKIMIYHKFSWKVFWILINFGRGAFWKMSRLVREHSEAAFGSPVTFIYSRKDAENLLKGFKVRQMKVDHIFPYEINEYKKYRYRKIWYFRYMPLPVFRLLEKRFGWHLLVTANS